MNDDAMLGVHATPPLPAPRPRNKANATPGGVTIVEKHLRQIVVWAEKNRRDATTDRIKYWMFKLPALLCATAGSVLEAYHRHDFVLILTAVATVCIGVDSIRPRGQLHNAHMRAWHELSHLASRVELELDRIQLSAAALDDTEWVSKLDDLLATIAREEARVEAYLATAEAALGELPATATNTPVSKER